MYYALRCLHCEHRFDRVAPASARYDLRCERCGSPVENDWERTGAPGVKKEWQGTESLSLSIAFDPSEAPNVARECPSVRLHPQTGQLMSANDIEHRRQLNEIDAWRRRLDEKAAPQAEAEKAAAERARSKLKEKAREYLRRRNGHGNPSRAARRNGRSGSGRGRGRVLVG